MKNKLKQTFHNLTLFANPFMLVIATATVSMLMLLSCEEKSVNAGEDNPVPDVSVILPAKINTERTLKDLIADPQLPDYIINSDLEISGRLTIEPGVVIVIARDAHITITGKEGTLAAVGTAEKNIRFIGQQPLKGYWSGIVNSSESSANVLQHTQVLHSGSKTILDSKKMALAITKGSHFAIKNCVFAENAGYGVFIQQGASISDFSENTFKNNDQAGINLPTGLVDQLDTGSSFTGGNGRDIVEVSGPFIGETGQKAEIRWSGFADKTPYRLLESVAVRTGWALSAGVTIQISNQESIIIDEKAYLVAAGTQTEKITFTGTENRVGSWKGMLIHSTSDRNVLNYAQIMNGGSEPIINGQNANIALYGDGAYMNIRNTSVAGSAGYGIYVGYGSTINEDFEETIFFSDNRNGDYLSDN